MDWETKNFTFWAFLGMNIDSNLWAAFELKKYKSELNISVLTKLSWQIVAEDACEVLAVRFGKVRHVGIRIFPVEISRPKLPNQW